jgi:hypothetical protein
MTNHSCSKIACLCHSNQSEEKNNKKLELSEALEKSLKSSSKANLKAKRFYKCSNIKKNLESLNF